MRHISHGFQGNISCYLDVSMYNVHLMTVADTLNYLLDAVTKEDYDATLADYDATLADYDATLADYDATLADYDATVEDYDATVEDYDAIVRGYHANNVILYSGENLVWQI